MKRTKQRFDKDAQEPPKYVSGCRQFEGEDVCKFSGGILTFYSLR
jgi:hypothetical protein